MRYFILFVFTCCFATISVHAETEIKAIDTNQKPKPIIPADCCCKDVAPCFEKDGNYIKKPSGVSQDIILDFRAKEFGIPKKLKLKKGNFIRVKVVNYNPLVYKVNVDNRDSSVSQPNDAGFLGMFLSPDKFSSAVAGLVSAGGTPPKTVEGGREVLTNTQKVPKTGSDTQIVRSKLDKYINDADTIKTRIQDLRKKIEDKLSEISKEYAQLQRLYLDCNALNEENIRAKADSFAASLKDFLAETRGLSSELYELTSRFKFELASYIAFIATVPELKAKHSFVDTFFRIAAAELNSIDTSVSSKKTSEMYTAFIKLTQNTTCYTSLPIYIGNDIKILSISIKPVDDKSNLPSYQTSFSIPDYQQRIWGVSGGIFISGLHNDIYTNKRKENDTTYNLVADNQNKAQIGVNALAYTGWKLGADPNYLGASFGAGMSLESKPKARILMGIVFITGEKNRIAFSAGVTGGFVSTLSDAFSTTADYVKPAENYQKDIMKLSGFFSINYSFISK